MNKSKEDYDENDWERYNESEPADVTKAASATREAPRKSLPPGFRALQRILNEEPYEVTIDYYSLRRLMQRHNQAIALLEEFLDLHPAETDLTRRTRCLVENPE